MVTVNNIAVVLGLWAGFVCCSVRENCTTSLYGNKTANSHLLTPAFFAPGSRFQQVKIHSGCETTGILVTACDDIAPQVSVESLNEVQIDRLGSFNYPGYASVIAYCPEVKHETLYIELR